MKIKTILFLILTGLLTASFTFTSVTKHKTEIASQGKNTPKEPVGGFTSEDAL